MFLVQERSRDQNCSIIPAAGVVLLCVMARVGPPYRGNPYGKHLYGLVKGWEAQSPLEEGEQGMMDLEHFQLQFGTRLSWRWDTGAAVGLRMSSGVGEHEAGTPPGFPEHQLHVPGLCWQGALPVPSILS